MKEDIQQTLDGRKNARLHSTQERAGEKKYSPKRCKTNRYGGGSSGD